MINLNWIEARKSYWYLPDETYEIDETWNTIKESPSIYKAFTWREINQYKSLMHFFRVTLRKHSSVTREKSGMYCGKYSVIIKGARSGMPLTNEFWGDPWKVNSRCQAYADHFYFGRKYKDVFDYNYYQKKLNEGSLSTALGKGFDDFFEAVEFCEEWKAKIIVDHRDQIEVEKNIMNRLFR